MLIALSALFIACATEQPAPTGVERLRAATDAITGLRSVSYQYSYRGTGSLAGDYDGSVQLRVTPGRLPTYRAVLRPSPSWVEDDQTPPSSAPALILSAGREHVARRDQATGTFRYGTLSGGSGHLVANAPFAVLFQLTETDPFASELEGELTLEGQETIGGVLCDVIGGTSTRFGEAKVTWYIGVEDDLPRAHRFIAADGSEFRFELAELDLTSIPMERLAIATERGEVVIEEDARPIEVGSTAPDWALTDADGVTVRLSELRGSIVVLDIGASWCAPCQTLAAAYDRLANERAAGPNVRFLTVNTWESPELSPADVVRRAGIGYPTLFGGEAIAMDYKLATLPALFVIDREGKFALVENPVSEDAEATTAKVEAVLRELGVTGG